MKNEKFLLDIQTKCGNTPNEILNVAIDTERTFKCKWPYLISISLSFYCKNYEKGKKYLKRVNNIDCCYAHF